MNINEHHGAYNISDRTRAIEYIVCHYVGGGTSAPGNALNNCKYFAGGDRGASAHYFIDDGGIWEYADPSEYYTWHCGDGHGAYGISNANSIGIEVCIDGDTPYTEDEIGYLSELVSYLMERYGIDADHVVRHYDASRKACPYYYTPYGSGGDEAWYELKNRITSNEPQHEQPESIMEDENMQCLFQPDGEGYMVWFDGTNLHALDHPDEMEAIKMVYRECYGREIPCFQLGTNEAPWARRFMNAVSHGAPDVAHL